jgi:hypothetical protein
MRNRECVACPNTCSPGTFSTTCGGVGWTPSSECVPCSGTPQEKPDMDTTEYTTSCTWECTAGYYHDPDDLLGPCKKASIEACPVGRWLKPHTQYSNSVCVPCTTQRPGDDRRVFVSDGGGADACREQCTQGTYLPERTLPCTTCRSNACDSSSMSTQDYKAVSVCEYETNALCSTCARTSFSPHIFTSNGGRTCAYKCKAGFYKRSTCGQWDDNAAPEDSVLLHSASSIVVKRRDENYEYTDTQGARGAAMVRIQADIKVEPTEARSAARIYTNGAFNREYTPRVSVETDGAVTESVMLEFATDATTRIKLEIQPVYTTVTVTHLSVSRQDRVGCIQDEYACSACATTTPPHSKFIESDACEWTCDEHYERSAQNTCVFCPPMDCATGEYMSGCGLCSTCESTYSNSAFVGAGVRGDKTSCAITCLDEYYMDIETDACTPCTLSTELSCARGTLWTPCTKNGNTQCVRCTLCKKGFSETAPCNPGTNTDTVCAPCTSNHSATGGLPVHATWDSVNVMDTEGMVLEHVISDECAWVCDTGYIRDELRGVCKVCAHECGVGEYESDCTAETGWEGCSPCMKPPNSTFTDRGWQLPNSCPWQCDPGRVWQDGACSTMYTTPSPVPVKMCTLAVDSCEVGQYLSGAGGKDCACRACAALPDTHSARFVQGAESCEWVCIHPHLRHNDVCVTIAELTREEVAKTAQRAKDYMAPGSYMEPVTQIWIVAQNGTSVDPLVVAASVTPFLVILVVVGYIILRV